MPNVYGWRRQNPDIRDKRMTFSRAQFKALPPRHERFENGLPEIWDQRTLGSCTAHGILRARDYAAAKAGMESEMLSRLQLYFDERTDEGTVESDAGAMIRTGIKSLKSRGVAPESQWPYIVAKFRDRPPNTCYVSGLEYQALKYAAVEPSLNQIKAALAAGYPVVFGFTVFSSMETPSVEKTGVVPVPHTIFDAQVGGHCAVFNGFWDDSKQLLGFDNSWGTGWGDGGLGYLPYWFVVSGQVMDCWVLYEVEGQLPKPAPAPVPIADDVSIRLGKLFGRDWSLVGRKV